MLRIALKLLLALSLILQGPLPVLAAVAASTNADDCAQAMQHGDGMGKKAPCCIGDCVPTVCMQVCVSGFVAFLVPGVFDLAPLSATSHSAAQFDSSLLGRDEGPPIRPPIV